MKITEKVHKMVTEKKTQNYDTKWLPIVSFMDL